MEQEMRFYLICIGFLVITSLFHFRGGPDVSGKLRVARAPESVTLVKQTGQGGNTMTISLSSTDFGNMETIPAEFTCDGANISPPIAWSGLPQGTESVALICDDPDAPVGTWVHWVCYDIPPTVAGLAQGVPKTDVIPSGGKQGINDFSKVGYGGPCPPSGTHRYFFKLYALDCMLACDAGKSKQEIEQAMKGHILGTAELIGTYSRK